MKYSNMGIKRTVLIRPIGSRVLSSLNRSFLFKKWKKLKWKIFLCIFGEIQSKNVCAIGAVKIFTNGPINLYTTYWYIAQWETTSLFFFEISNILFFEQAQYTMLCWTICICTFAYVNFSLHYYNWKLFYILLKITLFI